jgi:pyruvate dehydrogenase E2 component (dihydrolipoamide acetyltransferase)
MADFTMPSLGADMDSGTLQEWLVAPGDTVQRGDPMAVVDTDKAAIEVESFQDGVVGELLVTPGTRVAVGAPLARMTTTPDIVPTATPAPGPAPEPVPEPAVVPAPTTAPTTAPVDAHRAPATARLGAASPPVRHHAAELGVDLATVHGSGPGGAVQRADVDRAAGERRARLRVTPYARRLAAELGVDLAAVRPAEGADVVRAGDVRAAHAAGPTGAQPPVPTPPPAQVTEPEPVRPGGPRAVIAAVMARSKREIPHYYVATTVDLQATTAFLRRVNRELPVSGRIVPTAAVLRAVALAARDVPDLNGFWTDGGFRPADDVHLGVAVAVRGGALVAPAIHGTADLPLVDLMARLRDLVARARAGSLTRAEMADPTLTVTDLGDQGVEEVFGVIHPPQVALVGVGRVVERPWAVDRMLTVRPVVRLTLSGDHRASDGSTGARFLSAVDRHLQRPEEL